jgi:SHS2 domain-containing protein
MRKSYEMLEHTADICVRVRGTDRKQLFRHAAKAMFAIIARKRQARAPRKIFSVSLTAPATDELLVYWLNELLSLGAAQGIIFTRFDIRRLGEGRIEAGCAGISRKYCDIVTEIKAATYHGLRFEQRRGYWQADIIFDV